MSHGEKRGNWIREGMISCFTGGLFGATNTLVGHPLDTVKTKMIAQSKHMGKSIGYVETLKNVVTNEGFLTLYRGALPTGVGSIVFRATGFSAFELFFTRWEHDDFMTKKIPFTGGLELRCAVAGFLSGSCRAVLECPFEYIKVKRQTGQTWSWPQLYKGFTSAYPRACGIMGFYFVQMDSWRRHTSIMDTKLGAFAASGGSAMFAYWLIWPFEVLKNLTQAETAGVGTSNLQRARYVMKTYGLYGFYRGILPGSMSVFMRNGASYIVLVFAHKQITKFGLRG